MGGTADQHIKQNKSDTERKILHVSSYLWKKNK
jgi:hypothetical protein